MRLSIVSALLVPEGQPLQAGQTYLKLLHGRNKPDENLDNWGVAGPVFGPLEWFHITYLQTYRFGRDGFEAEVAVTEDMFVWDRKYYGDAEVFVANRNRGAAANAEDGPLAHAGNCHAALVIAARQALRELREFYLDRDSQAILELKAALAKANVES